MEVNSRSIELNLSRKVHATHRLGRDYRNLLLLNPGTFANPFYPDKISDLLVHINFLAIWRPNPNRTGQRRFIVARGLVDYDEPSLC